MGNSFNTNGAPIYFDSRSGAFRSWSLLCTGNATDEMQTTGFLRVSASCLTISSPLISRAEAMSCSRSITRSVHPPVASQPAASYMACQE